MKTSGDQVINSVWAWTSGSHCYLILKYALEQMKRKITQSHIFCLKLHQHNLSTPLREFCYNLSLPALITSDGQGHQNPARGLQSTSCTSKWLPVNQTSPEIQICLQSAALIGCWVFNKISAKLR